MMHIEIVAVTAQATFGRDVAMFEGLLGFVAQLSLVLWGLVILTVVVRFVGIWIYRRGAARTALVEPVAKSAAVPTTAGLTTKAEIDPVQPVLAELLDVLTTDAVTNATFDEVLQPAEAPVAVAASAWIQRRAPGNQRAEHQSAAQVPALAANSTEAWAWTSRS
ncbi:hypothetical protein GU243_10280 [Pseudarthrobacter psychrotolerans]|uniref:Uncharacterized protein n=1 Tax=Pseudarthrobacter psychrotolerans TaxID=2697569 RepID=A0A6P1NNF1_9MICC|nr:hypothetical protein [Pseudarthrobacter psychrotolerans]QHK20054.1 hypothetical protein GU243_10280 [Pseudarthrobacter psychrotolerans]